MKLRFLALLLLLPLSQMAKADLCADPTTHAYATCANAPDYTTGVALYDKTSIASPNSLALNFDAVTYGAKCDGSTDDTAAFQAAVSAMSTTGGTLLIPTGKNCVVGGIITLPSHSHVTGAGVTLTAKTSGFPWNTNAVMFTNAANATDITIEGINFVYPASASGATHIIQLTSTASDIHILNNTATYGGDFVANIGATNVSIIGNHVYNCSNACFDSWNNATAVAIIGNTATVSGSASRGIEFTGLTTGLTAANSSKLIAIGNDITLLGASEQGINVDGLTSACAAVASEKYGVVANNRIVMAAGIAGNAILLRFCSNYWDIHDNQIFSDGTDMAVAAIAVNSDSNDVMVHNNLVYNWNNQTSGAERGLFRNGSVGGTLTFNECYSCTTATTLVGATDSTTLNFGNDTGTGAISATLGTLTLSPGTSISQASWGTAGIALIGSAFTANDTTTGSGGVNSDVGYGFGVPTFTNTQGTANVLANAVTVRIPPPLCGSGWASCTNLYSLIATGRVALNLGADLAGASVNINSSNNFATSINTGTSNGALHLADGSGNNAVTIGNGTGSITLGSKVLWGGTTFTLSGGSGTCASTSTLTGGANAGKFTATGSTGTCAVKIVVQAATNDVACFAYDFTHYAVASITAQSTTGCTISVAATANDVIYFGALEF